ncbi:hypothetical protein IFR05_015738 [Cadophora sp. M221]|nr:hypothetical protein IFR05_015738 [Cadophora sp. M221]
MSWPRLGAIKKPEEISKILTWWDGVEHPTKVTSLSGMPVNRIQSFEIHPGNFPPESNETLISLEVDDDPRTLEDRTPESTFQNSVQRLLKALDGFDKSTRALLEKIHLSTLDNISVEVMNLWEQAHTTYPRRVQIKFKPPLHVILSRRGRWGGVDPNIALAQLWSPDPAMPVSLVGFNLPEILPKTIFRTSEEMSVYIEPFDEGNQQLLVTPTYCKTDLHIGMK